MVPRAEQIDPGEAWRDALAQLAADLHRVAGRLRGLTSARLARPLPAYGTVAGAGRHLAQHLADAAAAVSAVPDGEVEPRTVPELTGPAVGDQVAVTGRDLLDALTALTPDTQVPGPEGPATAAEVLAAARYLTRDIKLTID